MDPTTIKDPTPALLHCSICAESIPVYGWVYRVMPCEASWTHGDKPHAFPRIDGELLVCRGCFDADAIDDWMSEYHCDSCDWLRARL